MRLVRVELSRFFARRAIALMLVAAATLTVLVTGSIIWNPRPVADAELANAKAQVEQQVSQPQLQKDLESCKNDPEQFFGPDANVADCEQQLVPTPESYLGRSQISLSQELGGGGLAIVVILTALIIIVGTTYAGADWATGSMSNQLLFVPRRLRVWLAKALAVTLACAVVTAVLLVVFWLSLSLVAGARGVTTSAAVQEQIGAMTARGVTLAGLGGYALTMLLRSTVATLALLFAYAAGGEALLVLAPWDRTGLWSLTNNLLGWVQGGVRVFDPSVVCRPDQPTCDQQYTVSLVHGAVYLGVLLMVTLLVSVIAFRRRDIP